MLLRGCFIEKSPPFFSCCCFTLAILKIPTRGRNGGVAVWRHTLETAMTSTVFSPRRYRAALLENFNAPSPLVTPPSDARRPSGLRIENCSLLGNNFRGTEAPCHANQTGLNLSCEESRNPRSIVIDFIDQCVANRVPESVIVEHVLFMVHAMQEQISMTEALHARYHYDRLRHYEMSELTNMLERQQVYYEKKCQTTAHPFVRPKSKTYNNNKNMSTHQSAPVQRARANFYARDAIPPYPTAPAEVQGGRVTLTRPSLFHTLPSHAIFPQKLPNAAATQDAKHAHEHIHEKQTQQLHAQSTPKNISFQSFVQPTEASIRKERSKYNAATTEDVPPSAMRQNAGGKGQRASDSAALRGRQRLLMGSSAPQPCGNSSHISTWSDDDESQLPSPVARRRTQRNQTQSQNQNQPQPQPQPQSQLQPQYQLQPQPQPQPLVGTVSGDQEEGSGADGSHSTSLDPPSSLDWRPADPPAPPLSVGVPSQTAASLRLQAYIEHSQRKIRQNERLLASTPSGKFRMQRSVSSSSLSGELSELSDD